MNPILVLIAVYLIYGLLIAVDFDYSASDIATRHPNLYTLIITLLWGPIATFFIIFFALSKLFKPNTQGEKHGTADNNGASKKDR